MPITFYQIFLIASIIFIATGHQSTQKIINCDYFHEYHGDVICFLNKTGISEPNTAIKLDDQEKTPKIYKLLMRGNLIKFLPVDAAQNFPNVAFYEAIDGSFEKVEKINFEKLHKLNSLALQSKKLTTIARNAFEDLENLKYLEISQSSVEYFHSDTFKPLKKLRNLFLQNNKIKIFHPHAFDSFNNLETISFAGNNLLTLSHQLFINKDQLTNVNGSNNNYVYLDGNTFDGLKIEVLDLRTTSGSECSLYAYGLYDSGYVNLEEVKRDIRDDCKGSDFKIYETHAKILDIFKEYDDKLDY